MQASTNCADRQRQLEAAARAAFEACAGGKLTDAEWATVRAKLMDFAGILRAWDRTTGGGNVEKLCHREP